MQRIRIIKISLLLLFLASCGSRTKTIKRNETAAASSISVTENSEASAKIQKQNTEYRVSDLSTSKITIVPGLSKCQDQNLPGLPPEPRKMTVKDSQGNETSIPVDEYSEIHIENTTEVQSELSKTKMQLSTTEKENSKLQEEKEILQTHLDSNLKSQKPVFWLYMIFFFAGMVTLPSIKYLIVKK